MKPTQHAAVEAVYEDISTQLDYPPSSGQMWDVWAWHQIILGLFVEEQGWDLPRFVPSAKGNPIPVMRQKQSRLTKRQGSEGALAMEGSTAVQFGTPDRVDWHLENWRRWMRSGQEGRRPRLALERLLGRRHLEGLRRDGRGGPALREGGRRHPRQPATGTTHCDLRGAGNHGARPSASSGCPTRRRSSWGRRRSGGSSRAGGCGEFYGNQFTTAANAAKETTMDGRNAAAVQGSQPKQPQVQDSLDGMEKAVTLCEHAEEMLRQRLERACQPDSPSPQPDRPSKLAEVPIRAPLAANIDAYSYRLHRLNERLMALLNRVEV
jgi:hypothetical protein